mmetsp:Transcript_11253/g.22152  ORF Transcript_11253/g.22152 Transcript_11253/m.22152 type:complete len:310 (+) Transcript_11253:778-1707(+)
MQLSSSWSHLQQLEDELQHLLASSDERHRGLSPKPKLVRSPEKPSISSIEKELRDALQLFEKDKRRLQTELDSLKSLLYEKETQWIREKAELIAKQDRHGEASLRISSLEAQVATLRAQLQSSQQQSVSYKQTANLAEEELERYKSLFTARSSDKERPCGHEEELSSLKTQRSKLQESNAALQRELQHSSDKIYSLERQVNTLERSVQEVTRRNLVYQPQFDNFASDVSLKNQIEALLAENESLSQSLIQKDRENDRLVRKMLELTSESKASSLQSTSNTTSQKSILRRNRSYEGRRTGRKCYACDHSR